MSDIPGQLTFDAFRAEDARQVGMGIADAAPRVRLWKEAADAWFLRQPVGTEFTADDLVRVIGLPDQGVNRNNVVGAWMAGLAATERIAFTGRFRASERVVRHRNQQRVWRKR